MEKSKCMTIVLCAKGYPGVYKKNLPIKISIKLNYQKKILFIMQALTKKNNTIISAGGRVLNISFLSQFRKY